MYKSKEANKMKIKSAQPTTTQLQMANSVAWPHET